MTRTETEASNNRQHVHSALFAPVHTIAAVCTADLAAAAVSTAAVVPPPAGITDLTAAAIGAVSNRLCTQPLKAFFMLLSWLLLLLLLIIEHYKHLLLLELLFLLPLRVKLLLKVRRFPARCVQGRHCCCCCCVQLCLLLVALHLPDRAHSQQLPKCGCDCAHCCHCQAACLHSVQQVVVHWDTDLVLVWAHTCRQVGVGDTRMQTGGGW